MMKDEETHIKNTLGNEDLVQLYTDCVLRASCYRLVFGIFHAKTLRIRHSEAIVT